MLNMTSEAASQLGAALANDELGRVDVGVVVSVAHCWVSVDAVYDLADGGESVVG